MDYSHPAYFPGAPPYQFVGAHIPPLTPAHSNSVASEEFNTTSSPEVYDQFPNGLPHDQYQNFDDYVQFNAAQTFQASPTPPGLHPVHAAMHSGAGVIHQSGTRPTADLRSNSKGDADDLNRRQAHQGGSNSEDDDMTPAQAKRKAQNRAAQRAFRERKERHVKDLESRLHELEQAQQAASSENERLKRDLHKVSTENEILRATSMAPVHAGLPGPHAAPTTTGPMSYSPKDFYTNVLQNHPNKSPSHRIVTSDNGDRLLAAGATWEYIINHELFKRGLVDVGRVSDRLRPLAKCDGQGPVFEERAIAEAIQESVASGSDELI